MGQSTMTAHITREQALTLLEALPDTCSGALCSEHNPDLWRTWCQVMGRSPDPSPVWTECDVVSSCILLIQSNLRNRLRDQ